MTNSEKIIEMNAEELDKISGGIKLSDDQKEKIKQVIEKARTAVLIVGPIAGAVAGVLEAAIWFSEAKRKGKDFSALRKLITVALLEFSGLGIGLIAGVKANMELDILSFRILRGM